MEPPPGRPRLLHLVGHHVPAAEGRLGVVEGVRGVGRTDEGGDEGGLRHREVLQVLAEEDLRRLTDAVDAERASLPEVHIVQVELEDVVLAGAALEDDREVRFEELPAESPLRGEEVVLHQLLGEGAGALLDLSAPEVVHERAGNPDGIESRVIEKASILGREYRVSYVLGNRRERDPALLRAVLPEEGGYGHRLERHAIERLAPPAGGGARRPTAPLK